MDEDGEAEYGAPPRLGFRARGRWWPRGRRRMAATALGRRWGTRRRTRRDLGGEGKYLREEGGLTRTRSRGEGSSLSLALPRRGAASRSGGDRRHGRSVARIVKTTREGELVGLGRPGGLRPKGVGVVASWANQPS